MTINELAEKISLPQPAISSLDRYADVDSRKAAFYADRDGTVAALKALPDGYERLLRLYLLCALDTYDKYRMLGISDDIFFDTMGDIAVWCRNCHRDRGVFGLAETGWINYHIGLKVYKLGRLQFEPMSLKQDVELPCGFRAAAGSLALFVHVQQGAPLAREDCLESYARAWRFFRGMTDVFYCHSWLLAPPLMKLLPPESNIALFQSDFHVFRVDPDDRQCEERVFTDKRDDPSLYPEDTSLRRSVRRFLIEGGRVGSGEGVFKYKYR